MKRIIIFAMVGVLLVSTGCSTREYKMCKTSGTTTVTNDNISESRQDVYEIYRNAMEAVLNDRTLPDGTTIEYTGADEWYTFDVPEECRYDEFAIFDIDNDGADELIISFSSAPSAYHDNYIYQYNENTDEWHLETMNTVGTPYYDNGIIIDQSMHLNEHSIIIPYALRQYDSFNDEYILLGYVDGTTDDNGDPVYELRGFDGDDNTIFYNQEEYDKFLEDILGKSNEIDIPFIKMTDENIANI